MTLSRAALYWLPLALAIVPAIPATAQERADDARLYGRVFTTDGSIHEGFIRWTQNEAGVFDILSGSKRLPDRNRRDAERLGWEPEDARRRIRLFGVEFTLPGDRPPFPSSARSGIRFGHVSALEPAGSDRARVILKSGAEIELRGSGDIGTSVRLTVEDQWGGTIRLRWSDLRTVDFLRPPARPARWGERLYGTLVTRDGDRFTGYIAWDMDEVFTTDVLDGYESGRKHEIPFARVRAIARNSSSSARVWLEGGQVLVLSGTNDVNHRNRDIMVADPALGEVRVTWEAFDRLDFEPRPARPDLSAFDGGRRIRGTVTDRGGERITGFVRWDNDEEYTWELLNGRLRAGVSFEIEFGAIASIERNGYRRSLVTLRDGRTFDLGGSNDVNEQNKGLFIEMENGRLVMVPWDRFERLDLR